MSDLIRSERDGDVAVLHLDDGKANAVSFAMLDAIHAALDGAEKDASAVVMTGRPGRFSAGFDLGVMKAGGDAVTQLVRGGAELLVRIGEAPLPVVAASSGHALAMGALLLLGTDARVGAQGDFKIGLNETAIGMTLPHFAVELAQDRISRRHLGRAVVHAEHYDPDGAVDAGFLDRVVASEQLVETAVAEARALGELPRDAFVGTRKRVRGPLIERMRTAIDAELATRAER